MSRPQSINRRTSPRQTELDELHEKVRTFSALQDTAPSQIHWDIVDAIILRALRRIQELEYVAEYELVEEVDATRHQFRGQGL